MYCAYCKDLISPVLELYIFSASGASYHLECYLQMNRNSDDFDDAEDDVLDHYESFFSPLPDTDDGE